MDIIKELWYGNVAPFEQCTRGDKQLKELLKLVARNKEELDATLTDKQKETYEKYKDCNRELLGVTEVNAFVDGFTIAMKIMVEIGSVNYNTE